MDDSGVAPQDVTDADPVLLTGLQQELDRLLAASGAAPRKASAPPQGAEAAAVLSFDVGTSMLHWGLYNPGDYDQNGEVNAGDLTPIALHFGQSGSFTADSLQAVIDGDGNGEINAADVIPIAVNYGNRIIKYNVYSSLEIEDYPADGGLNGPGAALLGQVALGQAVDEPGKRLAFSFAVADPQSDAFYWVRPSDGAVEGTPSRFGAGENQFPIAVLNAEPANGLAPLYVRFNGYSSGDIDGRIVNYEWDFDGPGELYGWTDTDLRGWIDHTYFDPGDYIAMLRVTDNNGATDTDEILVRVRELEPPDAVLSVSPNNGPVPLKVEWDASLSTDRDGLIVSYEWDFDNDGVYEFNSGTDPVVDFYYYEPDRYFTTLRVTDNDGLSAAVTVPVDPGSGAEWHVTLAVDAEEGPDIELIRNTSKVLDVAGRPALFFIMEGPTTIGGGLAYVRAANSNGTEWGDVRVVDPVWVDYFTDGTYLYPMMVQNRPTVLYRRKNPEVTSESIIRNSPDAIGAAWNQPWNLDVWPDAPPVILSEGSVAYTSNRGTDFRHSSGSAGIEWHPAVDVIPNVTNKNPSLAVINGKPAIAFSIGDALLFLRASNAAGLNWSYTPEVVLNDGTGKDYAWLTTADGHPAIAWQDGLLDGIRFVRALDPDGEEWGEPVQVAIWVDDSESTKLRGIIWDGRPALLYRDQRTGGLRLIAANYSDGRSWGLPVTVSSGAEFIPNVNPYPDNLAIVNGNPAFCREVDPEGNYDTSRLYYYSYY